MSTYPVRLLSRQPVAEGTMAFHFEKPSGFAFKPGQAIDLVLHGDGLPADGPDTRHAFSIVSAPYQNELIVATRMRDSAFKRALGTLQVGDEANVEGPFGSLTLHKRQARAAVLIAGGIGVTPFMSMSRQATRDNLPQDLRLIYANHRPEDAAFLDELLAMESQNPRFRLLATMTSMVRSQQAWTGHQGVVDSQLLRQTADSLAEPIYYLAGPPAMVEATRHALTGAGVEDDDVRSEEFYGY